MPLKLLARGRETEKPRFGRDELAWRIARLLPTDGVLEPAPGLFLSRLSSPTGPIYGVGEPSFCVITQGSKAVVLGRERYRYDPSSYLLISAGVPLVGYVEASSERPYLGVRVVLDRALITSVLIESDQMVSRPGAAVRALAVSRLDEDLLDAMLRLVRLVDSPTHYGMLAPLVVREIVYRLSLGEQCGRLRQMATGGGQVQRIAKGIELLRKDFDQPLRIPGLARQLGMSVSGFHHQFKAVTAMSPLQFQKQLRMQEARRLLLSGEFDAATAGYRVGYEEPSHFSREYRKFFGEPPMRDVERLQGVAAKAEGKGKRKVLRWTHGLIGTDLPRSRTSR
ncbi:MAG TPA: AraC family transcriptional regulator [Planctomycetota bacterium]|nr:AraC family transcriptional regulator [Planctomycetota bacterium]